MGLYKRRVVAESHYPINAPKKLTMIKIVGETVIKPIHKSSCHCGAVELELKLPNAIVNPRRCNCSICRRKGAMVASVLLDELTVVKGDDKLMLYQFGSSEAKHYFCSVCGIYTHHQRRSNPNHFGINLGCLDGVEPHLIGDVTTHDGANNHPSDRKS